MMGVAKFEPPVTEALTWTTSALLVVPPRRGGHGMGGGRSRSCRPTAVSCSGCGSRACSPADGSAPVAHDAR